MLFGFLGSPSQAAFHGLQFITNLLQFFYIVDYSISSKLKKGSIMWFLKSKVMMKAFYYLKTSNFHRGADV